MTAISRVRGIGVADMARTSTFVRSALRCSLCSTPKRCSSSMMTRPRSLKRTPEVSSRCVPMTTSTVPSATPSTAAFASASLLNRDSAATFTGKDA